MSRNHVVIDALEEKLASGDEWPPELVHMLETPVGREVAEAADQMLDIIRKGRRSRKKPTEL